MIAMQITYNRSKKAYDVQVWDVVAILGIPVNVWFFDNLDQALGRIQRYPEIMSQKQRDAAIAYLMEN